MSDLSESLSIEFSSDETTATLIVQPGVTPSSCDREIVSGMLAEHDVKPSCVSDEAIDALLEQIARDSETVHSAVVARGTLPEHGCDGRFEWDEAFDPAHSTAHDQPAQEQSDSESHYGRSVFRMAEPGDRLATLTPSTPGTDGVTVRGKTLAAKAGKPYPLKLDESVKVDADGVIKAVTAGAVMLDGDTLKVSSHLEIAEYVDFSTGNIEFDGDITVRQGVRDLFVVHATSDIFIRGLVEGAEVVAGRDLKLSGGIAGREKGKAVADRDMAARYIDASEIKVGRHLTVEKEIINSKIRVGGQFICPSGTLSGGECSVAGACEVSELGAECGTTTVLSLGTMDEFAGLTDRLSTISAEIEKVRDQAQVDYDQLVANTSSLTPGQAEQMTELQFALASLDELRARMSKSDEQVANVVSEHTAVELTVHSVLHNGVVLRLGRFEATFKDPLKGPLRITLSATGRPQITDLLTESSRELRDVARVVEMDEPTQRHAA